MGTKQPDSSGGIVIRPWAVEPEKLLGSREGGRSPLFSSHFPDTPTQLPMRYDELYTGLKAVSSCSTPITRLAEDSAKLDLCLPSALDPVRCAAHFSTGHLIHSCCRTREFRFALGVYKPEFWFGLCVTKTIHSHIASVCVCNDCVLFPSVKCQTLSIKTRTEASSPTT